MRTEGEERLLAALRRCVTALEQTYDPAHDAAIEAGWAAIYSMMPRCQHDLLEPRSTIEVKQHGANGWRAVCRSCGMECVARFPVVPPPG